jgi:hypothetical protein
MEQTTYFDMDTKEGLENYVRKSHKNLMFFKKLFGVVPSKVKNLYLGEFEGESRKIIEKISSLTGISIDVVESMNYADELLNLSPNTAPNFGCTSIGRRGVIGQNLDLFTVDLSVVKEGDKLYVTMPPYLALFGMNKNISFCTNMLPGEVKPGVSVSQMRRNLLSCKTIEEAVNYLKSINRSTSVNFLISDGDKIIDIEVSTEKVTIHPALPDDKGSYFAHTNHFLSKDIREDASCSRLFNSVRLLQENKKLEDILSSSGVFVPSEHFNDIGFGSIITAVMDVKNRILRYKDNFMKEYEEISLN